MGAAGFALVPALAVAATSATAAQPSVKTTQSAAAILARETGSAAYASPASASKLVRVSAATPNPDLAVALTT